MTDNQCSQKTPFQQKSAQHVLPKLVCRPTSNGAVNNNKRKFTEIEILDQPENGQQFKKTSNAEISNRLTSGNNGISHRSSTNLNSSSSHVYNLQHSSFGNSRHVQKDSQPSITNTPTILRHKRNVSNYATNYNNDLSFVNQSDHRKFNSTVSNPVTTSKTSFVSASDRSLASSSTGAVSKYSILQDPNNTRPLNSRPILLKPKSSRYINNSIQQSSNKPNRSEIEKNDKHNGKNINLSKIEQRIRQHFGSGGGSDVSLRKDVVPEKPSPKCPPKPNRFECNSFFGRRLAATLRCTL